MLLYDLFVCHASEDKDTFVRPLAQRLIESHVEVWYDEFSLQLGDGLRRSIERGLSRSRYGVVVLSPSFFAKGWPQRELDGLLALEVARKSKVILPIWHNVTHPDVAAHSPMLADLRAVASDRGIDALVKELLRVVRPDGSPLVMARDRLIGFGLEPPVVTDEWWLDIVTASHREPAVGMMPMNESWGGWTFPLPEHDGRAESRAERLAWTALQLRWEEAAVGQRISQITPPTEVLAFINAWPGLKEICLKYPRYLACYAPQLTIPGFGGELEDAFTWLLDAQVQRRKEVESGAGLTVDGSNPSCEVEMALRHPEFGRFSADVVAHAFVHGEYAGPHVRVYEPVDYVAWVLSSASSWLPERVRTFLTEGITWLRTWPWHDSSESDCQDEWTSTYHGRGALMRRLYEGERSGKKFKMTALAQRDMCSRLQESVHRLQLPESAAVLADRFVSAGLIRNYCAGENAGRTRQARMKRGNRNGAVKP